MSHSIFWKITLPFIFLVVFGMGLLGFSMVDSTRNLQMGHLRTNLEHEARVVADTVLLEMISPATSDSLDTLVKNMGRDITTRITIIAPDGTVLGDTRENPLALENHFSRPEVKDALAQGTGQSTRYSQTTGQSMMYLAVLISDQDNVVGIARVALPLNAIQTSLNGAITFISWSLTAAALLVILAAIIITRRITRPIRQITRAAEKIASGQFDQTIDTYSNDELGRLSQAFNKMSANLKEMMSTISDEKSKLLAVLSTIADGVIMTDTGGNILLVNATSENLFNIQESRVIGKPLIEVVLNYEIEEVLRKCLATKRRQYAQIDTTGGKFIRVIAVPLKTDKVSGALLLFQDLTELRNLQTMRREFLGNVSHELRTPLTAIKAIVETLQDGAINDASIAQDFLNKVNIEVDNLTQMVNEIIELSRIETGKTTLNLVTVNLNLIIEEIIPRLSPQMERKPVALHLELAEELPPVQADKARLQQAITNLIHNAIKFTPSNGQITVKTGTQNQSVWVQVADTGIGISRKDLPHIFERFFKADKSRTAEGSGLGLAITKHIVQAHGGEIWVRSEEGRGSTFSFSIPIK